VSVAGRLLRLLAAVAAVPVALLLRALRPLILVRVGGLISHRIGHFAINTELYLCERGAGLHARRTFDVFTLYRLEPVCNQQLRRMWGRVLRIWPGASIVDRVSRLLPGWRAHVVPRGSDRDRRGLLERFPAHLRFTPEEEERGRAGLREMGIADGAPFVCFHARDAAYLEATLPRGRAGAWSYHGHRDSSIQKSVPAMEELARRGHVALRMGAVVKESLATDHPRIVDYGWKWRTDFLDVYLSARCRFFVATSAGIGAVAAIFRVPIAFVNYIPLEVVQTWGAHDLAIFKKLWIRGERRFMTCREMLATGASRFERAGQYEALGVEPVEHTPEEITALVVEMDERLSGTWKESAEDPELQARFAALFAPGHEFARRAPRIGSEFLRQNRFLLD
jgi:putative glycosyltransferase (TIGR04372 family)